MKINQNLSESDIDIVDIKSPIKHQIQQQEKKYSVWRFDKVISMTLNFHKATGKKGSS